MYIHTLLLLTVIVYYSSSFTNVNSVLTGVGRVITINSVISVIFRIGIIGVANVLSCRTCLVEKRTNEQTKITLDTTCALFFNSSIQQQHIIVTVITLPKGM